MVYEVDSLKEVLEVNNLYIEKVKEVLTGKIKEFQFDKDSVRQSIKYNKDSMNLNPI